MTLRGAGCALGRVASLAGPAWASDCAKAFRFEPDARLSVSAIGRLAPPMISSLETSSGGAIIVVPFDEEDQPMKGGERRTPSSTRPLATSARPSLAACFGLIPS